MITVIDTINSSDVLQTYLNLSKDITWESSGSKGKQSSLQYKDDDDVWSSSNGRATGNELVYSNMNPFFAGTMFEDIIIKYKLLRTRFMWVSPYSCYSMHEDTTPRIHVPIITNPDCYFVFKSGIIQHMPAGYVYRTNTVLTHTFMNCSKHPRLHLVGVVED